MEIRKAAACDIDAALAMYEDIIDSTDGRSESPRWTKGIYPDRSYLEGAAERGELFLAFIDGRAAGGVVFNHKQASGYENVGWSVDASPCEVCTIHTLGVHPDFQHRKIATLLSRRVIEEAEREGMKAVRLDVIEGNTPSVKLYESMGFTNHGDHILRYEGMDDIPFTMMELVL